MAVSGARRRGNATERAAVGETGADDRSAQPRASSRPAAAAPQTGRPLALGALLAGVGAPAVALSLLWFVGPGRLVRRRRRQPRHHPVGAPGRRRRLAARPRQPADRCASVVVTASPLGLTLLCGYLTYRLGPPGRRRLRRRRPARRSGSARSCSSGSYAAVALLTAVLAGAPGGRARPGRGLPRRRGGRRRSSAGSACSAAPVAPASCAGSIPVPALSIGYAAVVTVLLMVGRSARSSPRSASSSTGPRRSRSSTSSASTSPAGCCRCVLLAAHRPQRRAARGDATCSGSGFAVGTGTVVSPAQVDLGPVPSVPVLAALPDDGWSPGLGDRPARRTRPGGGGRRRSSPAARCRRAPTRAPPAVASAAAPSPASLLTVAASCAGGAIGPGRMADIGVAVRGDPHGRGRRRSAVGAVLGALPACLVDAAATTSPTPATRSRCRNLRRPAAAPARTTSPSPCTCRRSTTDGIDRLVAAAPAARPGAGRPRDGGHRAAPPARARRGRRTARREGPRGSVACAGAPHLPAPSGAPRRARVRRGHQPAGAARRVPTTRRTAPRWSPSAPTGTASRGWPAPSGPASRRSCTGSRTSPAARSGTGRSPRRAGPTSPTWWCSAGFMKLVGRGLPGRVRRPLRQHPPGAVAGVPGHARAGRRAGLRREGHRRHAVRRRRRRRHRPDRRPDRGPGARTTTTSTSLHERIKVAERRMLVDSVGRMAREGFTISDRKVRFGE